MTAAASCLLTSFNPPSSFSAWQPKEPSRTWHKHSLVQRPPSHNSYWMNPTYWLRPSVASSCTPTPIQPRLKPSRLYRLSPSSSPASLGSLPLPPLPPTPSPVWAVPPLLGLRKTQVNLAQEQGTKKKEARAWRGWRVQSEETSERRRHLGDRILTEPAVYNPGVGEGLPRRGHGLSGQQ